MNNTLAGKQICRLAGSFRDPSGFVYSFDGEILRQVNRIWQDHYDHLMNSGLYDRLIREGLLIPHVEADHLPPGDDSTAYKVIKPTPLPFISYPYEWSFSQIKDAAIATLKVQRLALDYGMSLTDANAYNIQFLEGKPRLIDTLSLARYQGGKPWAAYRQFCQFFLAPLALISYRSSSLSQLLVHFLEGVPVDLASSLLPRRTWLRLGLFLHLHLTRLVRGWSTDRTLEAYARKARKPFSRRSFLSLVDSLYATVEKLTWSRVDGRWIEYYDSDLSGSRYREHKQELLANFLDRIRPRSVWDLGANTGFYSRVCSGKGIFTIALDRDPACVEKNYLKCKKKSEANLLPLVMDLTNPSPAIGWLHQERFSLMERGPADLVLALGLVHHLAIGNNLPLARIGEFLGRCARCAVVEFIPKNDPKAQTLLRFREDIFPDYSREHFQAEMGKFFDSVEAAPLADSPRIMYLLSRN